MQQRTLGLVALTGAIMMTGCAADSAPGAELDAQEETEETAEALTASAGTSTSFTAKHSGLCMDVWGASTGDAVPVKQGTCNGGSSQRISLKPVGGGYYNLIFEHSGKCMDIPYGSTANGAEIQQHACNGGENQKFRVVDNYDGYHWIVAKNSGKCLDVVNASTAHNTTIQQYTCHGGNNQKFKLTGRRFYNVKPVNSGLCFDVNLASIDNDAIVMQGNCHGGDNQRFELFDKGNGYYTLVNKNSGKCVDVDHALTADGTSVIQSECHDGDNQMFQAVDLGNGKYKLVAKHSGKCLDVWLASTANAAPIKQGTCNGGTNQQFTLDELEPQLEDKPPVLTFNEYTNLGYLKQSVANDPTVIRNLATVAHMMGFAWAGGTQTPYLGQGFDPAVLDTDGNYTIQAHYDANDPYAAGYRAGERLKIKLSNFRTVIDGSKFNYSNPLITSLEPSVMSQYVAKNHNNFTTNMSTTFSYTLSTAKSHTTTHGVSESLKLSVKKTTPPGGLEFAAEFTVTGTHQWQDSTINTESDLLSNTYSSPVPALSQQEIDLMVLKTQSSIDYTTAAYVAFDITFTGFLRAGENARTDHPTDRPTVSLTFGNDDFSGIEDIYKHYTDRGIVGNSTYDWSWAAITYGTLMRDTMRFCKGDIGVPVSGRFVQVKGTNAYAEGLATQPL
ncbi:Alpha-glucosidase [Minicystis rosea]|nr:Alpha-glucosidase [Minicystis rosea]